MTRALIISDSHGLTSEILSVRDRENADYMIHCGDSELDADADELDQFYVVGGNCDFDDRYPTEQTLTINGVTFCVVHGHLHQVKSNLLTLGYRAKELGAQVICFGHTHIAGAEQVGSQLFINPGSIRLPRGRKEATYAIMEWETSSNITVSFYEESGEPITELFYNASF